VPGTGIDMIDAGRVRFSNALDTLRRNRRILVAEVVENGTPGPLVEMADDRRPVVGDGRRDRQADRGDVCDGASPAEPDDADRHVAERGDGRLHVGERVRPLELPHHGTAALDLRVIEDEITLDAVEERRRDRSKTFRRVAVDDAPDVRRQPEYLLDDDDAG